MKLSQIVLGISLFTASVGSFAEVDVNDYNIDVNMSLKGGFYDDRALLITAGRELQIWKMQNVTLGLDVKQKEGNWGAKVEFVPLSDEVKRVDGNAAYKDYYKNLGTDILYYGEYPIGEAYFYHEDDNSRFKVGRMVNIHGFNLNTLPYISKNDAPQAVYMDKEILNGLHYAYNWKGVTVEGAILNGRGRPDSSYNFYLNGQTDPNIKGNNTPVVETKLSYSGGVGGLEGMVFASYHHTKTGSAPGSLYSGKHNDNRMAVGGHLKYNFESFLNSVELFAQYSSYTVGLTEEGVQKEKTPVESQDIEKTGFFVTPMLNLTESFSVHYTFESIDRADTLVWDKVAGFDPSHPSMESEKTQSTLGMKYKINDHITANAFYTTIDNPYESISNISTSEGSDKFGLVMEAKF